MSVRSAQERFLSQLCSLGCYWLLLFFWGAVLGDPGLWDDLVRSILVPLHASSQITRLVNRLMNFAVKIVAQHTDNDFPKSKQVSRKPSQVGPAVAGTDFNCGQGFHCGLGLAERGQKNGIAIKQSKLLSRQIQWLSNQKVLSNHINYSTAPPRKERKRKSATAGGRLA